MNTNNKNSIAMAQFEKGKSGNPNGRPKGTTNKATATVRAWLVDMINANREQLQRDLAAMEPTARWELIVKLMPYILPKVEKADEVEGAAYTKEDIAFDPWGSPSVVPWAAKSGE